MTKRNHSTHNNRAQETISPIERIPQRSPQTGRLLQIAEAWKLFHDAGGRAYTTLRLGDHFETWPLPSQAVRDYLSARFFEIERRPPQAGALEEVLATLKATARFGGTEQPVFRRVAEHEGAIYVDLCDSEWRVVRVTADGWDVCLEAPVRFVRSAGMLSLPEPQHGGRVDELRAFVNVAGADDWRLVVAWLVMAFCPRGPYPILTLHGGEGTAKSSTTRMLRSLVDPNDTLLRSLPRNEHDLAIAGSNGWLLAFDNISALSPWLSDALCRIASGGGFATRRLYTNDEEVRLTLECPSILNGIGHFATREDFLSRAIVLDLPRIPDEGRRPERELWGAFDATRPRIFGALLDAMACALRNRAHVHLAQLPRMADFAEFATAAEPALGWEPGAFMAAYERNRMATTMEAVESDAFAAAILNLLEHALEWRGTPTELLGEVNTRYTVSASRSPDWPRSPRALTSALQRREGVLARIGVWVERPPRRGTSREICLRRIPASSDRIDAAA